MKVLVSFCNTQGGNKDHLYLINTETDERLWVHARTHGKCDGILGITQDAEYIYGFYQNPVRGISIIEKKTLKCLMSIDVPELSHKDVHSIAVSGKFFYLTCTGTNQVLKYYLDINKVQFTFVEKVWEVPSEPASDTHHLNGLWLAEKGLLVSGFGLRSGQKWSTAEKGYVYNITTGEYPITSVYQPHSVCTYKDDIYCVESATRSVLRNGVPIITMGLGYARGLAVADGVIVLGMSAGRKVSKSTRLVNNFADPGDQEERLDITLFKEDVDGTFSYFKDYNLQDTGKLELYDVMILN